jgi:murein L,D-transpeptidase YcbB/YkuD
MNRHETFMPAIAIFGLLIASVSTATPEDLHNLVRAAPRPFQVEVVKFYEASGYQPAWVIAGAATPRAREFLILLGNAASKGLDAADYSVDPPQGELARFDLAVTISAMRYISDLSVGRANPGLYGHTSGNLAEVLRNIHDASDLSLAIGELEPPFEGYRRTIKALERYRRLEAEDDGEILPNPPAAPRALRDSKVQSGDTYSGVPRLARLLRELGDLAPES